MNETIDAKNGEGSLNPELRAAVRTLYAKGIITEDQDIAKAVGRDKSTISPYLSGKVKASKPFIDAFQIAYQLSLDNFKESKPDDLLAGSHKITIQDHIELLRMMIEQLKSDKEELNEDKEKLYGIINSGLAKISKDQQYALAYQKAWVDREAEKESGGDKQKKNQIKAKMGKLVDGFLPPDETGGSQSQ